MQLTITTNPPRTIRVNPEAVNYRLGSLLEAEVRSDLFLEECGITVDPIHNGLRLRFNPLPTLRVEEQAVTHLLRKRLTQRVAEDPFLTACNIRLSLESDVLE